MTERAQEATGEMRLMRVHAYDHLLKDIAFSKYQILETLPCLVLLKPEIDEPHATHGIVIKPRIYSIHAVIAEKTRLRFLAASASG
jgi:hypothetical protein